jgi:two-component system NtrC family sensor kinase
MKFFKRLGVKLIIAIGVTSIVIIGIHAFLLIQNQSETLESEMERASIQLSETIRNSVRYGMLSQQRQHTYEICNTISEQPWIRGVRIFNKEGAIIYSTRNADIGEMVDKNTESCYACHAEGRTLSRLSSRERTRIFQPHPDSSRVMGVINPIYNEPSCWEADCHAHTSTQTVLGVLDVTVSLAEVDRQLVISQVEIAVFGLVAVFSLSVIIALFVNRWVDRPVSDLVNATHQIASGNLNYEITTSYDGELGMLAQSFNGMTAKLSEARRQLFQSDKMASLGRLAAGVAHEINNPLTGVLTYSSFLLKRASDYPAIEEDLKVIVRETKRSREIVKGLLDFARQSIPRKKSAHVEEVIERAVTVVDNQMNLKKIRIERDIAPNLPEIIVDANQLQQVFINLFVNAADAIEREPGRIKVRAFLIELEPRGVVQIKNASCPKNHSVIDNEIKIGGLPSIRMRARLNGEEGWLNLDPVYGSHRDQVSLRGANQTALKLSCAQCDINLLDEGITCPVCGAPVYHLNTPVRGEILGCSRYGCDWQMWDFIEKEGQRRYLEISIEDNGKGISRAELDKIFEPFYTTKGQKGTGLGLAVIWGIIDNHDGMITVESKVNSGTKFIIRLPAGKQV